MKTVMIFVVGDSSTNPFCEVEVTEETLENVRETLRMPDATLYFPVGDETTENIFVPVRNITAMIVKKTATS